MSVPQFFPRAMALLVAGLLANLASCGRSVEVPAEKHVLLPRKEGPVDLVAEGIDAKPFERVTDDPAVVRLLARGVPASMIKVLKSGDHEVLEWKGRKVFEATVIGTIHCETAGGGGLALEAITEPGGKPFLSKEQGALQSGNPWEVWIVRGNGPAKRVSSPGIHATQPVISPDGRYVACIAEPLKQGVEARFFGTPELMIKDLQEGTVRSYGEKRHGVDYHIVPVDWVKEGSTLTLRVLEDWGETGGHLTLKQVRVE